MSARVSRRGRVWTALDILCLGACWPVGTRRGGVDQSVALVEFWEGTLRIHTSRSFVRSLLPTACALIVLAILQGCTSGAIDMRQPSLLDQLANSSLSPVSPPPARGQ